MTDGSLRFEAVEIARAPGFESSGFSAEELSPGVTIVHGPNASGKSTLARSLQWLLWPDTAADRASVIGRISLDGEPWRIEVDSGRVTYQRDGNAAERPDLPPAERRDRYRLAVHDLIQDDVRDGGFARTIVRESAGGYDLAAAAETLGYDGTPSTRRKGVVGEAESAVESAREERRAVDSLREERNRLAALRLDLEAAKAADERATLLDRAIEYARAREAHREAKAERDEFPDVLDRMDGTEHDTVVDLDERIEDWRVKKREAAATIADAHDELDDVNLPDGGLPEGFVDRVVRRRDELESIEERRRESAERLREFRRRRSNALDAIPLDIDAERLADVDPVVWEEVDEFARTAEQVRAERELHDAVGRWLSADEEGTGDGPTYRRGSRALEGWLAHPPHAASDTAESAFRLAVVAGILLAAAGVGLATLVHPALSVVLLAAIGIAWYGRRVRTASGDGVDTRQVYREDFERLGLEGPASWTEVAVRERLTELYDEIATRRLDARRADLRETMAADGDRLAEREAALDERASTLRDRLGSAPDVDEVELAAIARGILRWQEAHGEVEGLEAKLDRMDKHVDEIRESLRVELEPYGYEEFPDAAVVTQHIRDLEKRGRRYRDARDRIARAEAGVDEAEAKIDELEAERLAVFDEIDVDPDDGMRLRELCGTVDAYRAAADEAREARVVADRERADLERLPGYDPDLVNRSVVELERTKRDAEETAASYETLLEEIHGIEERIRRAKRETAYEGAHAEKRRALDDLEEQLEADCASMVGHVLVEHVREVTRDASRPDVFDRAREILAEITRGRYRLDLDEESTTFRAFDTVRGKGCALDELSSGTRVQVLLAVRIAFVRQQERGCALPVILDETLANSDDGRAEVIIDAMIELARGGRQVVYLTAQGDEVAKWLAALDDARDVDHAVIDLAECRRLYDRIGIPDLDERELRPPSPPAPDGHDHEAYGRLLSVPAFDPRRGAGDAHLWYLVDDVELLHRLLGAGIERWGQLETMLEQSGGGFLADDPDDLETVACLGRALEEFVRSWRTGRGMPVDRRVLEASGAVSGTFIDEVAALAEGVDGNGRRIVDALENGEVNRFRRDKADELEAYFEEHGYIDPVDPLEPEALRIRVLECLVDAGLSREAAVEQGEALLARIASTPE